MRAILIDPESRSVNTVELDDGLPFVSIRRLLQCATMEYISIGAFGDRVYYDDRANVDKAQFRLRDVSNRMIAGKGVYVGYSAESQMIISPSEVIRTVRKWTHFFPPPKRD